MTRPLFMSPEHVAILNERLDASSEVKRLCAEQAQDYVLLYVLHNNPTGQTEYRRTDIRRDGGVFLALALADGNVDASISGDYWKILDALAGKGTLPPVDGDPDRIATIGKVLTSKEVKACAVPVTFPRPALSERSESE
jgi:hypothetical protein